MRLLLKRLLTVLIGALLLLALIVTATAGFLSTSEGGTRFLAAQAQRLLPVEFVGVSGALSRHVRVERLVLDLGDRRVTIHGLDVAMDLLRLAFDNVLEVSSLRAERVIVPAAQAPSPAAEPFVLELPFRPVDVNLANLDVGSLEIAGVPVMTVSAAARWDGGGLAVSRLAVAADAFRGRGHGRLAGGANPDLTAEVDWQLAVGGWRGSGRLAGPVTRLEVRHAIAGRYPATVQGTVDIARPARPAVDLAVSVADVTIAEVTFERLHGQVRGTPDALAVSAESRVVTPWLEPVDASVWATGSSAGPADLMLDARLLDGTLQASGEVAWQDGLVLDLAGAARELDTARMHDSLQGRVSGALALHVAQGTITLEADDIRGRLNGRVLAGTLRLVQHDDAWVVEPLRLSVGPNRLEGVLRWASGTVDARAAIAAPGLAALWLDVNGDLAGQIDVSGTWPALDGAVQLTSGTLQGFGIELTELVGNGTLTAGRLTTRATARTARAREARMDRVRLAADGDFTHLRWRFGSAQASASGELDVRDSGYRVRLADAELSVLETRWRISEPVDLRFAEGRLSASPVCLRGGGAGACLSRLDWHEGRLDTRGVLDRLPVTLLAPWLPVPLAEGGYLQGEWHIAGAGANWTGALELVARGLAYPVPGTERERVALPDLSLSGQLADGGLVVLARAEDRAFQLTGRARLAHLAADGALDGHLELAASDLASLRAFDRRMEAVSGVLTGQFTLSGSAAAPRVAGRLQLADAALAIQQPSLRLEQLGIELTLDDTGRFELAGSARQDDAHLAIGGRGAGLFGPERTISATLRGNRLLAEDPQWQVRVSPDLSFAWAEGRGRLTGSVTLPSADVRLETLPRSAPRPSADVVVIGREPPKALPQNPFTIDVDVILGDAVGLAAFGITAQLQGRVNARVDARGRTSVRGTLDITGGSLTAQGQTLTIESGSVVYNGPIGNPYLDVRAVRVIEDETPEITVGLHIRGNADHLTSSVFSEPPMAETRALSFLVLGRDLDESSDADGGQLVAAAINLGLSRSGNVMSELKRITGLDELSAEAETQDSFAIVAGKRLTDDLYVRYTYNTLSAIGAFLITYDLGARWHLEARSGQYSSMDLMYSFEK